jgi:parallel beta-helix repeat protein
VYDDSSPYYENVIVDKSINLIGEGRESTIIDGNLANVSVVVITADKVDFSGFTVQNSDSGILVTSSRNNIHDCRIRFHRWRGMRLQSGFSVDNPPVRQNTIAYNIFENNDWGLHVYNNIGSSIIGNIAINNTATGISISGGLFCTIKNNIMVDNGCGLWLGDSIHRIAKNEIKGNRYWGIFASHGNFNIITRNNFIDNGFEDGEDNYYTHASYHFCYWQYWSHNYWSPRRNLLSSSSIPYFIFRRMADYTPLPFNIDWLPASEPYDIGV